MRRIWVGWVRTMIYTGNVVGQNCRKRGKKEHPGKLSRDVQYYWRMGRDSNPRKSCPFSGFQDRRIRPLCHPSETVSFYPPVFQTCGFVRTALRAHHSFALGSVPLALLTHKQDRRYCPALPPIRNCFWRLPALLFGAVALYIFFLYFATVKSETYFVFCACAIFSAHIFV